LISTTNGLGYTLDDFLQTHMVILLATLSMGMAT
jgi:hypothetical protein